MAQRRGLQCLQEALSRTVPATVISRRYGSSSTAAVVESATAKEFELNSTYKSSPRHDQAILFTCTRCDTRSAKTFSKESYDKGVVIVRCGGCQNLHLISDRLGLFGDKGNIESFLEERGESIKRGSSETYEFRMEDFVGGAAKAT